MKSVCTPVPPITNGSAAGGIRLAPPASALSKMATRRLAASGTNLSVIQRVLRDGCKQACNRNGPRTAIPIARILQFSGKPVLLSRPRAANGTGLPARVQRTGTDCRLGPSRCLALKRAIRDRSSSLASGNRVNSHISPVWSGHTRAKAGLPCSSRPKAGQGVPAAHFSASSADAAPAFPLASLVRSSL